MSVRPTPRAFFRQSLKSESYYSDEIINIFLLRPLAAMLVWFLYPTRVTPNQITVAAIVIGFLAAAAYAANSPVSIVAGGLLVTLKDVADDADGQLARAKALYSRRGRFLDSIGDFVVDVALFGAITGVVYQSYPGLSTLGLGVAGLAGITLRVSYHVFYQASFLHREDRYTLNRLIERVTEDDRRGDPVALRLQVIFNLIYTWQDVAMLRIDRWCRKDCMKEDFLESWYTDRTALRISGLLGFGTEFALLTVCSVSNNLNLYLWLNLLLMNGIWLAGICYRRFALSRRLRSHSLPV